MSAYEETPLELEIRKKSIDKNPYGAECPNRHLWSEGYRIGAKIKSDDFRGNEILMASKVWEVIKFFEQNKMTKAAKILRDNI